MLKFLCCKRDVSFKFSSEALSRMWRDWLQGIGSCNYRGQHAPMSVLMFYSGLQLIGENTPTFQRKSYCILSLVLNVRLIPKHCLIHAQNAVWSNQETKDPVKWTHKIKHYTQSLSTRYHLSTHCVLTIGWFFVFLPRDYLLNINSQPFGSHHSFSDGLCSRWWRAHSCHQCWCHHPCHADHAGSCRVWKAQVYLLSLWRRARGHSRWNSEGKRVLK